MIKIIIIIDPYMIKWFSCNRQLCPVLAVSGSQQPPLLVYKM